MDGLGYVQYIAFVVEGDEDGSGIMKSCFVVIVVKDVVGRVGGRSVADSWRNRSCLVDGLGDVRCFAVVVQGNDDGSGIIKSCFIVIVVNDVGGQGSWDDQNQLLEDRSCLLDGLWVRPVHRRSS